MQPSPIPRVEKLGDEAPFRKEKSLETKIAEQAQEVKMLGSPQPFYAIECGTLEVFLSQILPPHTIPVRLAPLTQNSSYGGQNCHSFLLHVTALLSSRGPILYATFQAAQLIGFAGKSILTFPYRAQGNAETRALHLQQEMEECLSRLIQNHPTVQQVIKPARFRLPDEWAWGVRSYESRIICQGEHWVIATQEGTYAER
jgi:hypothetical protein